MSNTIKPLSADMQALIQGLERVRGVAIKRFLKYEGLTVGTGDSPAESVQRVVKNIEDGKLSLARVQRALIEFQEYGGKRIYLFQVPQSDLKKIDLKSLPSLVRDVAKLRIVQRPATPRLNYSFVDGTTLRICFSEEHRQRKISRASWDVVEYETNRVIVIQAELASGFVTVAYDHPWMMNPHESSPRNYYSFYVEQAASLLNTQLVPLNLRTALSRLRPSDLITISKGRDKDLTGDSTSFKSATDVRHMDSFKRASGGMNTPESGVFHWLRTPDPRQPTKHGFLARNVTTEIHGGTGMVRFTQDTLVNEVRYVFGHIRDHV